MTHSTATSGRAPLRAADWRFLLPHPPDGRFHHLVLLGAPPGLAGRIREVGLATQVSDALPPGRSADAVVALHGARDALDELGRHLVPGGVLYREIDRRVPEGLPSAPGRVRRSLRRAGLSLTGMYSVTPDFSEHRMYLPLDVPGALRWYVETRHSAFTPWQRLQEWGLRAATGLDGRRFATVAPRLAVTAVAGQAPPAAPSVLGHPALPTELRQPGLRPLMLTHGGDRVVILPFAGDGARPAAVLKVPRLPGFNGRTENEHETLRTLRSRLDPLLRDSVPRPLGTLRHGEITVGIESYAPGELLFRSMERWGTSRQQRLDDLTLAAAWLAEFHFQSQVSRTPWGEAEVSQWVEGPFDAYRRAFGSTEQERGLFADAREYAGSLDGTPLPIVLQHRDFTVWNIARSGRALAVFDWEGCRPGPALCDLLHFVTHWYEAVHHAHHEAARQHSFRRLFFEPDRRETFSEAAHRAVAQYMQRLDIGRRLLPLLLVYTWVELALRRFDQQRLQEETASAPREGNRYLGIVAILADGRQQLFAREPLRASQPRPA